MTIVVKTLVPSKYCEATQTTQYTATDCTAIIDKFTATNTSGTSVTMTVNLPPGGGAASAANIIAKTVTIPAGNAYTFPELVGHTLLPTEFISTLASVTSAVVLRVSGREIT